MRILLVVVVLMLSTSVFAQTKTEQAESQVVEAACGRCQFHMEGVKGCSLAVRVDGNTYLVSGSSIRDHGNMHAADGLCTVVRKAEVVGSLVDEKFKVTSFKLLPMEEKKVKVIKKVKG